MFTLLLNSFTEKNRIAKMSWTKYDQNGQCWSLSWYFLLFEGFEDTFLYGNKSYFCLIQLSLLLRLIFYFFSLLNQTMIISKLFDGITTKLIIFSFYCHDISPISHNWTKLLTACMTHRHPKGNFLKLKVGSFSKFLIVHELLPQKRFFS